MKCRTRAYGTMARDPDAKPTGSLKEVHPGLAEGYVFAPYRPVPPEGWTWLVELDPRADHTGALCSPCTEWTVDEMLEGRTPSFPVIGDGDE